LQIINIILAVDCRAEVVPISRFEKGGEATERHAQAKPRPHESRSDIEKSKMMQHVQTLCLLGINVRLTNMVERIAP
jgi:hypothetical protein